MIRAALAGALDEVDLRARSDLQSRRADVAARMCQPTCSSRARPGRSPADYDAQAARLARMFRGELQERSRRVTGGLAAGRCRQPAGPSTISSRRLDAFEPVIGLEIHAQLRTAVEDLLRLQHGVWRAAQHPRLSGLPRAFRARCRC